MTIKHIPKKINKIIDEDHEFDKLVAEIENNDINNNINNVAEYTKPITLILNNDVIEYRKSDGYINASQLCKAGGKKFND